MRITISARHCEVTDALKERATELLERLAQASPHALDATVVFDAAPLVHAVEIRLHARGRKVLVGIGEAADHRSALDQAEAKLRPQLEKATRGRGRPRRASTQNP
jgi:putative sigma-54 modulation protein